MPVSLPSRARPVIGPRSYREVIISGDSGVRLPEGEATVKTHVSRMLTKLDLRSRVQAAVLAKDAGLVG